MKEEDLSTPETEVEEREDRLLISEAAEAFRLSLGGKFEPSKPLVRYLKGTSELTYNILYLNYNQALIKRPKKKKKNKTR